MRTFLMRTSLMRNLAQIAIPDRAMAAVFLAIAVSHSPVHAQQTLRAHVELLQNGHKVKDASNAVVWLTPLAGPSDPPPQTSIPRLEQRDKAFHPSLVVVPVGGKVEFPNNDPFFHNVFSLFEGKRFDLGLYESGTTRFVQFDRPGISYIFCNIHAQMSAVVVALSTPYYGVSQANGEVTIASVPSGRYQMQVFHASARPEDLQSYTRDVTVTEETASLGALRLHESDTLATHKNKYGRDYDPPSPDSPVYTRP
jgi:plastocyanin